MQTESNIDGWYGTYLGDQEYPGNSDVVMHSVSNADELTTSNHVATSLNGSEFDRYTPLGTDEDMVGYDDPVDDPNIDPRLQNNLAELDSGQPEINSYTEYFVEDPINEWEGSTKRYKLKKEKRVSHQRSDKHYERRKQKAR
ncbi:hypothetical protein H072_7440 [Dactylellina haptotyla CBS 200.50]|uniref:Uncharacterized protein n=1 Tax=Dactylellina haptotyla (strain CBS 200.50) TaxID=1284197 RepID=S8A7J8_DACHA|nr:hypothetical protein H072_7440 [Dactylellina haptotyla CBS 200.50]